MNRCSMESGIYIQSPLTLIEITLRHAWECHMLVVYIQASATLVTAFGGIHNM